MPIALPLAPSALASYQLSYNGLVIGDGTNYALTSLIGIQSLPVITPGDVAKQRDSGEFMAAYFPQGREIEIDLEITDTSDAAFFADVDRLNTAFVAQQSTELQLAYLLPGMPQVSRYAKARCYARQIDIDYAYSRRYAVGKFSFHCTDPRLYDSTAQSVSCTLPIPNGGVTWPITWPVSWGSASTGGTVTAYNSGNFETRPLITIQGPVDNPTVTNLTTGLAMSFQISLLSSDQLVIDAFGRSVLLNGGNRYGTMVMPPQWWTLVPGANSLQYSANTIQTGSTMTVQWSSAWL